MKTKSLGFSLSLVLLFNLNALALTRYVNVSNPTPAWPYTNWDRAATDIQSAIDAATAGDLILVTNGVYQTGGRVVNSALTNRVVINKAVTVQSVNGPVVTTIIGYQVPGTTNGDSAIRCVYLTNGASISGFTLTNGATRNAGVSGTELNGGGVWSVSTNAGITRCILVGNSAYHFGGGAYNSTLNNCTLAGNSGYYGGGAYNSTLNNCTLAGNSGYYGGGAYNSTLNNCVVYFNTAATWSNCFNGTLNYCCTTPMPAGGSGNITNSPQFIDQAGGNLRLQPGSPCINAGNNAYAPAGPDLDGNPRIVGGTVDIGAYELQPHVPQTLYVDLNNPNPVPPYTNWSTAATDIQSAIDAATAGDLILVTNGIYATGTRVATPAQANRVAVTKPVTVQSVNGPAFTIVQGESSSIRCVYLTNGTVLSGFTLTNGCGGVWCESTNAVITNSVIINCIFGDGAGAYYGTLNNCLLIGNSSSWGGGGAMYSTLNNCTLSGNTDFVCGGGALLCTLNNCLLTGNSVPHNDWTWMFDSQGGGAFDCTLNNCLLTGNSAGDGGGSYSSTLNNCTLVGNYAFSFHVGETEILDGYGGGAYNSTLNNCIIYYNNSDQGCQNVCGTVNYCCTPNPGGGVGNITFEPRFVDQGNGNLRLQSNSPCINAGNNSYVTGSTDLDGNPRIFGGTVDMGAYEFQGAGNVGFVAWLQQYGLPTDGSADYADPDGDRLNNWQEWRTGTVPTNAASVLKMVAAFNTVSGVIVCWQSVINQTYFLQRSTNLSVTPAFSTIQTNIAGQTGTTSYTDTNAPGSGPFFYRAGVP